MSLAYESEYMNKIELLRNELIKRLPGAVTTLDSPIVSTGSHWLDVQFGGNAVVIEWRPSRGFGLSSSPLEGEDYGYGEGPDEVYDNEEEALERLIEILRDRVRTQAPTEIELKRLREARGISQEDLAKRLGIRQASVSKMERQSDMNISTLRRFVQALGGSLELSIRFPDHTVKLAIGEPSTDATPYVA
jgi:DNA-binding XRE family transcriptional regulator